MDLFERKDIKPMLIGDMQEAFDSSDYIYELKLDGERCIAYIDEDSTELRNKRNMRMLPKVPELSEIHKQVKCRCILDGELIVIKDGVPNFFEIQRRSIMSDTFKIQLASTKYPATFTAFDILYYKDHGITDLPLMERKKLLEKCIKENERLAISRFIHEKGIALYDLAKINDLEGIVAKRKNSKFYFGKLTKEWIKIKNLLDDDYVVCGYILKNKGVASILLAQFKGEVLVYKGHVALGVSTDEFKLIQSIPRMSIPSFDITPSGNEDFVWVEPILVCSVKYMMKTAGGSMRQPIFKGLRDDKEPRECMVQTRSQ